MWPASVLTGPSPQARRLSPEPGEACSGSKMLFPCNCAHTSKIWKPWYTCKHECYTSQEAVIRLQHAKVTCKPLEKDSGETTSIIVKSNSVRKCCFKAYQRHVLGTDVALSVAFVAEKWVMSVHQGNFQETCTCIPDPLIFLCHAEQRRFLPCLWYLICDSARRISKEQQLEWLQLHH